MKILKQSLQISESVNYVPLSGELGGLFYHTIFIPRGIEYDIFVLFEDGSSVEVIDAEVQKGRSAYSYFNWNGGRHIFDTKEKLWFQPNLVNGVSAQGIGKFIGKKIEEGEVIFSRVKGKIQEYYDFFNTEEIQIVAAHVIHTYFLNLIGKTFYLLLDGEKNTGKSSLQNVMALLQYNGCFIGKSSIPAMVGQIHHLQASINLDEFEKLDPKDKSVVTGILNTGAYKGGTRAFVNMEAKGGNSNKITIENTFGAKTFSVNKAHFSESFMSRCVVVNTIRNRRKVKSIYDLSFQERVEFQEIRDMIFGYVLKNGRDIMDDIRAIQEKLSTKEMYGRRADILAILLGIIGHFKGGTESLEKYLYEKEEMEVEDEANKNRLYFVLDFLLERCTNDKEPVVQVTNAEIVEHLSTELEIDLDKDSYYTPTASSVGKILKRSKIVTGKNDRKRVAGKGNYQYMLSKKRIIEIVERSGYDDLIEKAKTASVSFTPSQEKSFQSVRPQVKESLASSLPFNG